MGWIPENQRTTAWYLFEEKFLCKVPQLATRTIEDIKQFGVFTTGDKVIDRELAKEWTLKYLSIAKMEEIFNNGHNIKVVNFADTKKIYELISAHLITWRDFFGRMENSGVDAQTLDELVRLDKFAAAVYEPAKHLFTEEIAMSLFGQYQSKQRLGKLLARGMFKDAEINKPQPTPTDPNNPNQSSVEVESKKFPERRSMIPLFEHHRKFGVRQWS
jgi:hypothetical protein